MESISLRAAALTYYSIMAIVPTLAVLFGIAQLIGASGQLDSVFVERFPQHEVVSHELVHFARDLLSKTRGGVIAVSAAAFLYLTIFSLFWHIEDAFNSVLQVESGRSFLRRILVYTVLVILSPIALLLTNNLIGFAVIKAPFAALLIPLAFSILFFTFLYKSLPNRPIPLSNSLFAGTISAIAFQAVQWLYLKFQIGVSTYGLIYGSFAAIPLFLVWIHTSWMVVLYGGKLAYSTLRLIKGASF